MVNKHSHVINEDEDVYIGRGSILGNPYTGTKELSKTKALFQCDSREEAIQNFKEYIADKILNKDPIICNELNKLYLKAKKGNINLVCYCSPKECHGDFIKELIETKLIKKSL